MELVFNQTAWSVGTHHMVVLSRNNWGLYLLDMGLYAHNMLRFFTCLAFLYVCYYSLCHRIWCLKHVLNEAVDRAGHAAVLDAPDGDIAKYSISIRNAADLLVANRFFFCSPKNSARRGAGPPSVQRFVPRRRPFERRLLVLRLLVGFVPHCDGHLGRISRLEKTEGSRRGVGRVPRLAPPTGAVAFVAGHRHRLSLDRLRLGRFAVAPGERLRWWTQKKRTSHSERRLISIAGEEAAPALDEIAPQSALGSREISGLDCFINSSVRSA